MPKFTATHHETTYTNVDIEITADSLEEAEEISRDWNIDEGDTDNVKVIQKSDNDGGYSSSDVEPKKADNA